MGDETPLFGELLLELRLITKLQLQEALSLRAESGQRVGEALISLGYVTREQLQTALLESLGLTESPPSDRPPLGELLVGLKYITREQLDEALERQRQDGRKLGELLVERGHCTYKQIYEALGLQQQGDREPQAAAACQGKTPGDGGRRLAPGAGLRPGGAVREGLRGLSASRTRSRRWSRCSGPQPDHRALRPGHAGMDGVRAVPPPQGRPGARGPGHHPHRQRRRSAEGRRAPRRAPTTT